MISISITSHGNMGGAMLDVECCWLVTLGRWAGHWASL